MKKVIAWLLVLALTAAVSIGATLAYLTDTDEDVNVMTLGKVKIDQLEYERVDDETADDDATVQDFHDNKPIYPAVTDKDFDYDNPGDTYVDWTQIGKDGYTSEIWDPTKINNEIDKMVFVKNKGDYDAYVRTWFAFEANGYTVDQFKELFHLNLNDTDWTWEWQDAVVAIPNEEGGTETTNYVIAVATYNKVLEPGKLTEISLSQIALDSIADNEDIAGFGDTYQVLVKTQAIQAQGFENPGDALEEGFGTEHPFETDSPIKGIDLRTALHNLDGDTATPITTKVTNVIYALNEEYLEVVDNYDGTLVDIEQDVPVYAYYVPNGDNYDVYFLANDTIYSPKDSSTLYKGMTALKTVDTHNYDVSRAETMKQMFRECSKLTTLDTTDWDTSKVTDMSQTFYKCGALQTIPGIENWDTDAVTTMKAMFRQCGIAEDLDLTAWNVENVTTMAQMFYQAPNVASLNAKDWDTGACTDTSYMFTACGKLQNVDAAGWDTSEVTTMYAMFGECGKLASLDATGWTNSKVTNTASMFLHDGALTDVKGEEGWNFASLNNAQSMFEGAGVTELNVATWDMSKAENLISLFAWCNDLVTLQGTENWDCSNATNTYQMFYDCRKLTELDTSNWGFNKVTSMALMFGACYELKSLDVSTWDVSTVTTFAHMFASDHQNAGDMALEELIGFENWQTRDVEMMNSMFYGCGKLKHLDFSGWGVTKLKEMGHMFADCYQLESVDFTGWNTPSLITMDAMFNNCEALKTVDMSMFDTSNVKEFSQLFEACYVLEEIKGLENWDTSKACTFTEMFSGARSLKELDLSNMNTGSAYDNYIDMNNSVSHAFVSMFAGMNSLEKLVVGENIRFLGNGNVTESRKLSFPAPANVEGSDGKWYNVETGVGYLPSEIPEGVAATYVAVNPNSATT